MDVFEFYGGLAALAFIISFIVYDFFGKI